MRAVRESRGHASILADQTRQPMRLGDPGDTRDLHQTGNIIDSLITSGIRMCSVARDDWPGQRALHHCSANIGQPRLWLKVRSLLIL